MATQLVPKRSGGSHQNGGGRRKLGGFHYPARKTDSLRAGTFFAEANDWTIAADLEGLRHHPQLLRDSSRKPDVILASLSSDFFFLVELRVPREERIEASNVLKTEKYSDLTKDLKVKLMPIEVDGRDLVGKSTYTFFSQISLSEN